ncbi:hypothetical protein [Hoylesella enoeca]|uniref:Fimbrillin family protein n=1 Tax=Hoylesella enoeca TaxID=76123 RepID=A0A0S2KM62_9BACT|nr:hypothetical protein [Hoylesella enoeca]ALO49317.1 hypothetical protein AS203_09635 [Hoylesella enoeca]
MTKTKLIFAAALAFFVSCANDDTTNKQSEQEPGTEGLTSFVEEDQATRTTGEYDGSGLNFYWTTGDRLWVHNGTLIQDARNNINTELVATTVPGGVQRAAKAKFWFSGTYTASSYPVRYTGKNGAKDKVTIKASQTQTVPNDASHIGEDGDCGVATATKPVGGGQYHFTLDHKAAYATFLPYNAEGEISGAKITKIKITANQAIAGTFDFDDSGLKLASRPTAAPANQTIELDLSTMKFGVPKAVDIAKNAATMVVAPGTYATLKVEYTVDDPDTHNSATVTRNYTNVTFTPGKNKKITVDLGIPIYENKYYLWDAQHDAWYGYYQYQPTYDGVPADSHYPQSAAADPDRWFHTAPNSTVAINASNSCKDCPNSNQMIWYTMKGNPHWDGQKPWSVLGHLYVGGMWFKKAQKIADDESTNLTAMKNGYPDPSTHVMTDWRTRICTSFPTYYTVEEPSVLQYGFYNSTIKSISTLASTADYFFLPTTGFFGNFPGGPGQHKFYAGFGDYWSSNNTPTPATPYTMLAASFNFTKNNIYFISGTDPECGFYVEPQWFK